MNDCCQARDDEKTVAETGDRTESPLSFVTATFATPTGPVRRVRHEWTWRDWAGALKMRLAIGRMSYAVPPGLYASGNPSDESPVLVTGNYKLTLDHLRRAIRGVDAWLLVLDTRGINVWCAAGKGTFGTAELINRIATCRLSELVTHRTVVLPQLGAPGVAAHQVLAGSGFRVVYGPVRAADLPEFLAAGMRATDAMRTVTFRLSERMAVVPVEIVHWAGWLVGMVAGCSIAAAVGAGDYSWRGGAASAIRLLIAFGGGLVLGPALFPWLPGRAFAAKGVFAGIPALAIMAAAGLLPLATLTQKMQGAGWVLVTLGLSSFLMLGYTGSSPCTSFSGTLRETRIGVRLQCAAGAAGLLLLILPVLIGRG